MLVIRYMRVEHDVGNLRVAMSLQVHRHRYEQRMQRRRNL